MERSMSVRRPNSMCTGCCSDLSGTGFSLSASEFLQVQTKIRQAEACPTLHPLVIRTTASLGRHPGDDFVGVGDVARFAMHAVRPVDLQARLAFFLHHFVDRGGAKILAGISIFCHALSGAHVQMGDDKMAGLILFVPRA